MLHPFNRILHQLNRMLRRFTSWHKAVTDAGFGQQVFWPGRIGLQFLPQMPHINSQIVAVFDVVRSPDVA